MPRHWSTFPSEFSTVLTDVSTNGSATLGPYDPPSARALRMKLWRFRAAVDHALAERFDEHLALLSSTFGALTTSTRELPDGRVLLHLRKLDLGSTAVEDPALDDFIEEAHLAFGVPIAKAREAAAYLRACGWTWSKPGEGNQ